MKHTPGPWSWGDDWRVPDEIGTVYFSDGENPAIKKYMDLALRGPSGTVIPIRIDHYEVIYDGKPISKADRALIAAAPDLLAALEAITRRVPILSSTEDYRVGQEHALEGCREVALAALSHQESPPSA